MNDFLEAILNLIKWGIIIFFIYSLLLSARDVFTMTLALLLILVAFGQPLEELAKKYLGHESEDENKRW